MNNSKKSRVKFLIIFLAMYLLLAPAFASATGYVINLRGVENLRLESNGGVPVNIQDQTSPPIDLFFSRGTGKISFIANQTAIDDTSVNVTNATGFNIGDYLLIAEGDRFYNGELLVISGNTLFLDTPIDYNYTTSAVVVATTRDLNVDGSITPQIFIVRGAGIGSDLELDITRIMISMETDSAVSLAEFGDIPKLEKGIVVRRVDGTTRNFFNVKTNGELAVLAYDYTPYLATNPVQGQDGALFRYTFAGQDKHGVAVRLKQQDELQIVIQDDLSSLAQFRIVAEGHEVTD